VKNCWIVLATAVLLTPCFAEMKRAVRTESGLVSGVAARDASVTVFKGIPYAEPPLGNLRWTAPRPPLSWEGVRNADHFSDACAQIFPKADFPKSEDCLYLNIWTPAKSSGAGLPMML
jgi:para-nitrobenzyl esterase